MKKDILYIQALGWNRKEVANWSYRYYKLTFIANSIELLSYNGIYADIFGSVENVISKIREYNMSSDNKKLDLIYVQLIWLFLDWLKHIPPTSGILNTF